MTPRQNLKQWVLHLSLGLFLGFILAITVSQVQPVQAAPLMIPPDLTLVGTCDTDGNSSFAIKNIGGAMSSNYTWELYQEGAFLTSGVFNLTASGTAGDSQLLTINGLYGNITVTVKDGTTSSAVQILSSTAFCEHHTKVTIKQAAGQLDPALSSPILFTATFESAVTGFDASDVTISGMAGTPGITVTGSGSVYTVAVTGMAMGETVTATIGANVALSTGVGGGYGNQSSTSNPIPQDNKVTYLGPPNLTLAGTCDTDGNSSFAIKNLGGPMSSNYTWELYQEGAFLTSGTFNLTTSGTAGDSQLLTINGLYGNIKVTIKDGTTSSAVQILSSTAFCEHHTKVTIKQAAGQLDPTNSSPIRFTVTFESAVTGFDASDVTISGMAGTPGITVTGSGSVYTVAVTGMANGETVTATVGANVALSTGVGGGYGNQSSTSNPIPQDNKVTYDLNGPTVTINQAAAQADPTNSTPIKFDIVFSEAVTGFTNTDVKITGMAGTPVISVTDSGDHIHFTADVSGMANGETVIATIPAYAALNSGGHGNFASTSTDNLVTYDSANPTVTINQASGQPDPTNTSPITFDVTFSEAVTGFINTDVNIVGMAGVPGITVTDSGDHIHFTVSVTGAADGETIAASLPANAAIDLAGNLSAASTSTDNKVTYDLLLPTVTINQGAGQSDPTSSSSINFDVTFNEVVNGFDNTDLNISGMAGIPGVTVTDSGDHIHFTVAVTGMANGETITATVKANTVQDTSGNGNSASTSTDNQVTYDITLPTVTLEQGATQADPTNSSPITFDVVFSKAVTGFSNTDVNIVGMAGSPVITVTDSGDHMHFTVDITGMVNGETVTASIPASVAQDAASNDNSASTSADNSVTYDLNGPTVTLTSLKVKYTNGPTTFTVTFSDDLNNPSGDSDPKDVTNPANYLLINKGANGISNTISCLGGLVADDTQIAINNVTYSPNTATINLNSSLPVGNYRLFVCGTTSITDLALNELGNGTDYTFDFVVASPAAAGSNNASSLPKTGFAPNTITSLPAQPANLAYADLGSIWLEIPTLKVKSNIVGVPQSGNTWDINWLGNDTGWLDGTAFPSWEGNSVLTGHVTNSNGQPGPFSRLKDLKYGDRIIVHILDQQYIFEIRSTQLVRPDTTNFALEHLTDDAFLTLITCQNYDEQTDTYRFRRIVRAILVEVK